MYVELTIVRLAETKEPVAVFDQVDCIALLGSMIDEVTDPASCEYADVFIDLPITLLLSTQKPDFMKDEYSQIDATDSMHMGWEMSESIKNVYIDDSIEWLEMPQNFRYLGAHKSIESRFKHDASIEGDVF